MTTSAARCDRIIALIDECLSEYDSTPQMIMSDARLASTRIPPRRARNVRSAR